MNILQLNTWGKDGPYHKRWPFLLRELERLQPDILCCQEVFDTEFIELVQKQDTLKLRHMACSPIAGLAVLSRFTLGMNQAPIYRTRSPLEDYVRGALLARIRINGQWVTIVTTHMSWLPKDVETRSKQVRELIVLARAWHDPVLLSGDFNDVVEGAALQPLIQAGYQDLFALQHPGNPSVTWDNQHPYVQTHATKMANRRIDFLFADTAFLKAHPLKACEIVLNHPNSEGTYVSDHYGVLAEFE